MIFSHRLRVRFNECDPQRIVFNANYVTYVDLALTELWRAAFGGYAQGVQEHGVDLVVGELTIRFRAAATFDDELDVALAVTSIGTTAITMDAVITRGNTTIVEGALRHVCVDAHTMTKTPVPAAVRARLLEVAGAGT